MGKDRHGAGGKDKIMKVPVGTQIYEEDGETLIADFTEVGQRIMLAKGGNGGFGNAYFKTSTNQAPRRANPGQPGRRAHHSSAAEADRRCRSRRPAQCRQSRPSWPRVTAAKPKIADYPFTTLHPQLGVVRVDDREFVLADLPGLIEGAHEGVGLGDKFLGHTERCRVLLHLVDGTGEDAGADYKTVRGELDAYGNGLEDKPEIVALSKSDSMSPDADQEAIGQARKPASRRRCCFGRFRPGRHRRAARTVQDHHRVGRRRRTCGGAWWSEEKVTAWQP